MLFSVLRCITLKPDQEPLSCEARIVVVAVAFILSLIVAMFFDRASCLVAQGSEFIAPAAEAIQVLLVFMIAGVAGRVAQTGMLLR
mmetsp:Transcript_48420/g.108792  ORF Transcript_48420/g.108792 Transcript_48420/m.108792 type:complete len:86 (-) Transcript_48420:211-468(-)